MLRVSHKFARDAVFERHFNILNIEYELVI